MGITSLCSKYMTSSYQPHRLITRLQERAYAYTTYADVSLTSCYSSLVIPLTSSDASTWFLTWTQNLGSLTTFILIAHVRKLGQKFLPWVVYMYDTQVELRCWRNGNVYMWKKEKSISTLGYLILLAHQIRTSEILPWDRNSYLSYVILPRLSLEDCSLVVMELAHMVIKWRHHVILHVSVLKLILFLFVWFDSLRLINNLSVKQGRVFLG